MTIEILLKVILLHTMCTGLIKLRKNSGLYGNIMAPTECIDCQQIITLLGEHIDYSGYSVLPMALGADIVIAFCKTEKATIEIVNRHQDLHK